MFSNLIWLWVLLKIPAQLNVFVGVGLEASFQIPAESLAFSRYSNIGPTNRIEYQLDVGKIRLHVFKG